MNDEGEHALAIQKPTSPNNEQIFNRSSPSSRSQHRFNGNDTRAYRRGNNNNYRRNGRQSYTNRRAC
jgi:hypothetical protein